MGRGFVHQSARTQAQTKHTCYHSTVLVQDNWIVMQHFQKFNFWETQLEVVNYFESDDGDCWSTLRIRSGFESMTNDTPCMKAYHFDTP